MEQIKCDIEWQLDEKEAVLFVDENGIVAFDYEGFCAFAKTVNLIKKDFKKLIKQEATQAAKNVNEWLKNGCLEVK